MLIKSMISSLELCILCQLALFNSNHITIPGKLKKNKTPEQQKLVTVTESIINRTNIGEKK